jgi:hypothetical protein
LDRESCHLAPLLAGACSAEGGQANSCSESLSNSAR